MSRRYEEGIPALYKYQGVKYFHFDVPPGVSYVLSADPWSFLQAWLAQRIPESRSKNRNCLNRALYYARLAGDFYWTADSVDMPIKATLTYYGMLNLVKCYLSVKGVELERTWEHHGLSLILEKKQTMQIKRSTRKTVSIFAEFARLLDKPVSEQKRLSASEVIRHIPEVHEMAYTLEVLPWAKRKFLPIQIDFLVNATKRKIFTEVRYEKKNDARVDTTKFYVGRRKEYFDKKGETDGWIIFRSKKRKNVSQQNFRRIYQNIKKEYECFDFCSILRRDGYKYYCDLKPGNYHHLCFSLALLFYIGSVARYRPTEVEELEKSRLGPIVNEALAVVPTQFLYQLVSLITSNVVVVPQSKLG